MTDPQDLSLHPELFLSQSLFFLLVEKSFTFTHTTADFRSQIEDLSLFYSLALFFPPTGLEVEVSRSFLFL